jgi:hypothetical protein
VRRAYRRAQRLDQAHGLAPAPWRGIGAQAGAT